MANLKSLLRSDVSLRQVVIAAVTESSELLSDDEISTQIANYEIGNVTRHLDDCGFESVGIKCYDYGFNFERGEEDGEDAAFLMVLGDRCVSIDVRYPSYCDDECDGQLTWCSEVMSLEAGLQAVKTALNAYRESMASYVRQAEQLASKVESRLGGGTLVGVPTPAPGG